MKSDPYVAGARRTSLDLGAGATLGKPVDVSEDVPESSGSACQTRFDFRILQALRRIIRAVDLHSRKLSASYKITTPQLVCLLAVREHGLLTPNAIARHVHVSPSTVIGILDRLEAKGLVQRERSVKDRRFVYVSLTETGCALIESAPSPLQETLVDGIKELPEAEQAVIVESLERIVGLMEAQHLVADPILTTESVVSMASGPANLEKQDDSSIGRQGVPGQYRLHSERETSEQEGA